MKPPYLTKSLFITAMKCPAKLYYSVRPEYANKNVEDSFLNALAEGGFQVGELAKYYFKGGHQVLSRNHEEALMETDELLKSKHATIFEAAIRFKDYFIRTDILIKKGNKLELIEVKAKSIDGGEESFFTSDGTIQSRWMPYLLDVAFQKYVLMQAFPKYKISAHLMLADKNALCPTDGLNQKFKISKDKSGRKSIIVTKEVTGDDLSNPILCKVNVDASCNQIYDGIYDGLSFGKYADFLAYKHKRGEKIAVYPSAACAYCEFIASEDEEVEGYLNGYKECWKESMEWQDEDFNDPMIFEIWNFRGKNECISRGCIKIDEITEEDIAPQHDSKPGISASQRRWLQVVKTRNKDDSVWIDKENMQREMESWRYPLHFIDFETTMVAIPFNKGRRPYEGIAFQYSHHIIRRDGQVEHKGQYLNTTPGFFPNYEFMRNLKSELEKDKGSIFRYAAHENTYLNLIYRQLMDDEDNIPDREELCKFIKSITKSNKNYLDQWEGPRNMIDMLWLVKRYYYDPAMKGSNSIKHVLPARLNSSKYLQDKYSKPIYGSKGGIPSLNYTDWKWIEFENGKVRDPYTLLPKMFKDISDKELDLFSESDEIMDGGAALAAYARMQFEEMSDYERKEIQSALLKYCELDTMAMVMIVEGWREMVRE